MSILTKKEEDLWRGSKWTSKQIKRFKRNAETGNAVAGVLLRDWFAGQALAGRIARDTVLHRYDEVAEECFKIAEAMVRASRGRK